MSETLDCGCIVNGKRYEKYCRDHSMIWRKDEMTNPNLEAVAEKIVGSLPLPGECEVNFRKNYRTVLAILAEHFPEVKVTFPHISICNCAECARKQASASLPVSGGQIKQELCALVASLSKKWEVNPEGERFYEALQELEEYVENMPSEPAKCPEITFKRDPENGAGLHAVFVGDMPVHHFNHAEESRVRKYMERLKAQFFTLPTREANCPEMNCGDPAECKHKGICRHHYREAVAQPAPEEK